MSDGKGKAKADDGAKTKESLEDQDRREVAQEVVSWLHEQYTRIHERRTDYVNLFSFICFGILWLLILGLQRDTTAAYEVQNTLNTHLLPEDTTFDNMEGVYSWAQDTVSKIWVNPVCGDGLCEEPWEFPQYADFGCRADCGDLPSRFNLTTLQLDLEWDSRTSRVATAFARARSGTSAQPRAVRRSRRTERGATTSLTESSKA